jgi:hypothetical protein
VILQSFSGCSNVSIFLSLKFPVFSSESVISSFFN